MQPEFNRPEFLEGNSAEEIHERMMNNLPDDIDDMPGGFPYDMTMPAALEKRRNYQFPYRKGTDDCVSGVCLG